MNALDIITEHYLRAGVWSSVLYTEDQNDGNGIPMDAEYEWDDCSNIDDVRAEITDFIIGSLSDILDWFRFAPAYTTVEGLCAQLGHDFLLTRDRHGTGFWDRGRGALGQRLAEAAHVYGDSNFEPNDDGLTYTAQGSVR